MYVLCVSTCIGQELGDPGDEQEQGGPVPAHHAAHQRPQEQGVGRQAESSLATRPPQ